MMNFKYLCALFIALWLSACTFDQLGQAAYGSLEGKECQEKTGGLSCNLDERSTDAKMINGAPVTMSNEEMEEQARKIQSKNNPEK